MASGPKNLLPFTSKTTMLVKKDGHGTTHSTPWATASAYVNKEQWGIWLNCVMEVTETPSACRHLPDVMQASWAGVDPVSSTIRHMEYEEFRPDTKACSLEINADGVSRRVNRLTQVHLRNGH